MPGVSSVLRRAPPLKRVFCSLLPASLRPTTYHPHHDCEIHLEHFAMPNILKPYDMYISLYDHGPVTFLFLMFLAFGFSG